MRTPIFKKTYAAFAVMALIAPASALAESETNTLNEVKVISTTPLEGIGLSIDKVPANVQVVKGQQMQEQGSLTIADYLNNNLQGVSVVETQGNPYQPDVYFHGFNASSLLGAPQGLSVYVDGVRVNEPFGDVVSWDLIPMNAIDQMQLIPGTNPVFGLNTLGGAVSIKTKRGRTNKGGSFENTFGSWGRKVTEFEYGGVNDKGLDYFFAATNFQETGWRDASPTSVSQYFGQLGWQDGKTDVNFTISVADNSMTGNGVTPSKMLDLLGRDSVYTKPDQTKNQMLFMNLTAQHELSDTALLSGNAYYRYVRTSTMNGDSNGDMIEQGNAAAVQNFITACRLGGYDANNPTALTNFLNASAIKTYTDGTSGTKLGTSTEHLADTDTSNGVSGATLTWTGVDNGKTSTKSRDVGITPADLCNAVINTSNTKKNGLGGTAQWTSTAKIGEKDNQLTAGISYNFSKIHFTQDTQYGYFGTDRGVVAVPYYGDATDLNGTTNTVSLYASNTYSMTDKLHVTTAARFDRSQVSNLDNLIASGIHTLTGDHTFQRLNPSIGLNYELAKSTTGFISYNEGSRAPTSMELGCANPDAPCKLPNSMAGDPDLKQVVTKSVDLGLRGVLGGGVGWSASLYRAMNYDDIQFLFDSTAQKGYFSNVGKTKRQGLDLGIFGANDSFNWSAAVSYVDATYQDGYVADIANNTSKDAVIPGNRIPGIPDLQVKLRGSYQVTPAWRVGSNVVYMGSSYLQANENNGYKAGTSTTSYFGNGKADAYTVVHLDTTYKIENTNWQLLGKINNLLDTKFNTGGIQGNSLFDYQKPFAYLGDDYRDSLFAPGAPRALWVGVKYEFDKPKNKN